MVPAGELLEDHLLVSKTQEQRHSKVRQITFTVYSYDLPAAVVVKMCRRELAVLKKPRCERASVLEWCIAVQTLCERRPIDDSTKTIKFPPPNSVFQVGHDHSSDVSAAPAVGCLATQKGITKDAFSSRRQWPRI